MIARTKNPEDNRRRADAWAKANPEKRKAIARRYRRKILGWYNEDDMATRPTQFKELSPDG